MGPQNLRNFFGLVLVITYLAICQVSAIENRQATPVMGSHKKPPFNGSIFGKRTVLPAKIGGPAAPDEEDPDDWTGDGGSSYSLLLNLIQQREELNRAALSRCQSIEQLARGAAGHNDLVSLAICAELLGDHSVRKNSDSSSWFSQLI